MYYELLAILSLLVLLLQLSPICPSLISKRSMPLYEIYEDNKEKPQYQFYGDDDESPRRYIRNVVNLRKLVYQELKAVKESFNTAQRTMNEIDLQIREVGDKLQTTTGRTGETSDDILLKDNRIDVDEEAKLQRLKKEVRTLKSYIPYKLIYPPPSTGVAVLSQQLNVGIHHPNVVSHPRTSSTIFSNRTRDNTYQFSWKFTNSEELDRTLAECNPRFYFLHHPHAPIDPSYDDFERSINSIRDECSRRILECLRDFPSRAIIKRTLLFNCLRAHTDSSSLDWKQFDDAMNNVIAKGFIKAICKRSTSSVSSFCVQDRFRNHLESAYLQLPHSLHFSPLPSKEPEILYSDNQYSMVEDTKSVKALLLGKWHRSLPLEQHIEVADPDLFYKGMKKLTRVRYISLRGISMIPELPQFITKLKKLQYLDCKDCHNLEVIPENINKLWRTLTHLDMSECHLLDHMPTTISDLLHLQVLKGFYLGDEGSQQHKSCTLRNLTKLSKLRKLHIYTSIKRFPNTDHLTDLQKFESLRNLAISWRAYRTHQGSSAKRTLTPKDSKSGTGDQQRVSFDLEKLDLRWVPNTVRRDWLNPVVFKGLKKLYITGGIFFDLGQNLYGMKEENTTVIAKENQWTVEILRLKYLRDLKMDKSEVDNLFPELTTLEKVDCPNVTSFCCDDHGIWIKPTHSAPTSSL